VPLMTPVILTASGAATIISPFLGTFLVGAGATGRYLAPIFLTPCGPQGPPGPGSAPSASPSGNPTPKPPATPRRNKRPLKDSHDFDPNSATGPAGVGSQNFISSNSVLPYRIDFENDPSATAPAQRVLITDQLDPNLNWSSFEFTAFGFGDTIITIPSGSQHYQTTVSMSENGQTFDVEIELELSLTTGQVTALFQSIDPTTELPPDVLTGYLPPENGTGRGMGYLSYIVSAKPNLSTGSQIRNVASVTFGVNAPITTD